MSQDIHHEVVSQDVDLTGTSYSTAAKVVDLDVPADKVVVGAGALLTHVNTGGSWQAVESLTDWAQYAAFAFASNGPHPTDAEKWRFALHNYMSRTWNGPVRFRVWLIAVDPH